MGLDAKYTIDYTNSLPTDKGFEAVEFDNLANSLDSHGKDIRGYELKAQIVSVSRNFNDVDELETFDGAIIYHCDSESQFNGFTAKSPLLSSNNALVGSKAFATASKLSDGDIVEFKVGSVVCKREFKIDQNLKGTIALNPTFDLSKGLFELDTYRFDRLKK